MDARNGHKTFLESIDVDYPYAPENLKASCELASIATNSVCSLRCPAVSVQYTPTQQSFSPNVAGCEPPPPAIEPNISKAAEDPMRLKCEKNCRNYLSNKPEGKVTRHELQQAWAAEHPYDDCVNFINALRMDDLYEMGRTAHKRHFFDFSINFLARNPNATQDELIKAYEEEAGTHRGKRSGKIQSMFKSGDITMKALKDAAEEKRLQLSSMMGSNVAISTNHISSQQLGAVRRLEKRGRYALPRRTAVVNDLERFIAFAVPMVKGNKRISRDELTKAYLEYLKTIGITGVDKITHIKSGRVAMTDLAELYVKPRRYLC
jgi:hypothetical protein